MSYRENRKISSSSLETELPFQALEAREKGVEPPKAAIRIVYGEVNPDLPGWEQYKTPQGMNREQDSVSPYQIGLDEFSPGKNTIFLVINFNSALLQPISKHYIQNFPETNLDDADDRVEDDFVWFHLPIADIVREDGPNGSILTVDLQHFTGNVNFRPYYSIVNGALVIEYFECKGKTPTLIPVE